MAQLIGTHAMDVIDVSLAVGKFSPLAILALHIFDGSA
jgi:hypothetical protein